MQFREETMRIEMSGRFNDILEDVLELLVGEARSWVRGVLL